LLILDDNATSREVFCKHLELSNLRCSAVPSVVEARALVHSARKQGDPFSFLLLDLVTSPEDVEAFCTELRDENAMEGLSIVGLTVVGNPSSAILSDPNLVARHLYKPVRFIDLCACLEGLLRVPASRTGDVVVRGHAEEAAARPLHVLVVEDTVTNQVVARMMVEKLGHKCHVVANGLEALEVVRRQHFDCILMDCMMPEMDGFETTRRIRAGFCGDGPQDVHIIAMTANAMRGDRERCIESGMDEYISKPVRRAELASKLENVQRLIYAACAD
jgi:CheY-like chemotaxis protein